MVIIMALEVGPIATALLGMLRINKPRHIQDLKSQPR